ncbi:hypothetical protein [Microbacterium sp. NPDC077184]|uniref:hypothetical protein n=1 Tax=Microbacterium sp. NPDC077184 TaxID=3154764 RepID=UPI003422BDA9
MSGAKDISSQSTTTFLAGAGVARLLMASAAIMFFASAGLLVLADSSGWRLLGSMLILVAIPLAIWGGRSWRIHRERSARTSSPQEGGR